MTVKLNAVGFDLAEYRAQKAAVEQAANAEVATRLEQVKVLLKEIQEVVSATGIEVDVNDLGYLLADMSDDYSWTSSSY